MTNLYASSEYKGKIMSLLCRNQNFIDLINPTENDCPDIDIIDVLYGGEWIIDGTQYTEQGHIFDYNFVNETTTEERTFVFVETDISTITDNIFTEFNLYVCIFTSKDLIRLTPYTAPTSQEVKDMGYYATVSHGNRIDALCECVDSILNGTDKLVGIGTVNPAAFNHMTVYTPNTHYYGKCLKYNITNYNVGGDDCGL